MKNTKLLKMAVAITCITLMAGCAQTPEETKETSKSEEETVVETETTVTETEASVEETETPEETTVEETEAVKEIVYSEEDLRITDIQSSWREFIENYDDDGYFYSFVYDDMLCIDNGAGIEHWYGLNEDGEIVQNEDFEYEMYEDYVHPGLTYDDVLKAPVFSYMGFHGGITFDEAVPDGKYYGFLIAVSDDGKMLYGRVGEPVVITNELLDEQNPDFLYIEYNDEIIFLDKTVGELERPEDGEAYDLFRDDGTPVTVNDRLVIIPIADDAVITSNAADYELTAGSGNSAMTNSDAWTFISDYYTNSIHINDWYRCTSSILPIVIEGGQVTEVNFRMPR